MGRAIFQQLGDSKGMSKGDFLTKGSGKLVILECLQKNGNNGDVFVARVKILESKSKDGVPPNAPGSRAGWIQNFTLFKQTAVDNVKSFVLAVVGVRAADITSEQFIKQYESAINYVPGAGSEQFPNTKIEGVQDFRGLLVDYDSYDQQTKAQKAATDAAAKMGQKVFEINSYIKFYHVADQGDIEARKAELDKTDPIQG